jgi:hypothetical protein
MDTLFPDSEVFQKERPTNITEQQAQDYYRGVAEEIIQNGWSKSPIEYIIEDVSEISEHDSGYEIAKELESFKKASYRIETPFIEFLDDFGYNKGDILRENIRAWAAATNPQPKFTKGQKLIIETDLNYEQKKGTIIYVNSIYTEDACYVVDEDRERQGGYMIAYEKIESRCSVIE